MRWEVFAPLEMADAVADARDAERMPPGHEYYFGTVRPADRTFDTSGLAYGYLAGSVTDLAHLAVPLLNHGRYRDTPFLAENTVAAFQRGGPEATCGRYPLGWRNCVLTAVDTPIVWHTGAVTGYHSAVIAAPDAGWAIAVQQNVYSPLHDEALNHAAFGALALALGSTPTPPPADSTQTLVLFGLGALAVLLAGGLVLTACRLVRRPGRRIWLAAGGWGGFGVLAAVAVGSLPGMFDLRLGQIVRFMPDIGQLVIAVVVLGALLAASRLVTALFEWRARRAGSPS